MRTKKILFISLFFFFFSLIGIGGCDDEVQYEDIPLEYVKCPCEHETEFIKQASFKDVLLFDATKISFDKMKELSFDGERSLFIYYLSEKDSTVLYSIYTTMMGVGYICNLPDEVKKWEISFDGEHISLSADEFEACEPRGAIAANSYSNLVLTSLKRTI